MPCIEEWLSNPLLVIDNLTADNDDAKIAQVKEYFNQRLSNNAIKRVQSINDKNLDDIKPNNLVRFRCMIQDMFEPEYYLSTYETIDKTTSKRSLNSGLYRDMAYCKPGHEVDLSSSNNITKERECFYCVPIPGETDWTKQAFSNPTNSQCNNSCTSGEVGKALKRDYHEMDKSDSIQTNKESVPENKKVKEIAGPAVTSQTSPVKEGMDLNLPLPNDQGPACIIKVYGEENCSFKVNDVVEFVGILSVDPMLTDFKEKSEDEGSIHTAVEMEIDEHNPQSLPSSLVARVHAVCSYKLQHSNPLLEVYTNEQTTELDMDNIRSTMLLLLQDMLYGDELAAEYLLLHLISTVYSRPDTLALGKYTLNLIGVSKEAASQIAQLIEFLVPKFHRFPFTITNLNQSKLVPKKNYQANRLTAGKLQLTDGTHLILDETVLEEGKLDNNGVQNIAALNHVILWQKLQYDFTYYKTDFPTNINVLVLSEGKSLLEADCRVRLQVKRPAVSFAKMVEKHTDSLFNNMRKYLALARLSKYEIKPDTQQHIEADFVQMRQESPRDMTVDVFHHLLCLARLLAISHCRNYLLKDDWMRVKKLEKLRLSDLPQDSR